MAALDYNTTGIQQHGQRFSRALSNTTGSNNIALGVQPAAMSPPAATTSISATQGVAGDAGKIRIGTAGTHTATLSLASIT